MRFFLQISHVIFCDFNGVRQWLCCPQDFLLLLLLSTVDGDDEMTREMLGFPDFARIIIVANL